MTDIQSLLYVIDPTIDWASKDLTHIAQLNLTIATNKRKVLIDTIMSDRWPEAIPQRIIVTSEEEKQVRATSIINNFIREPIAGKKFLDFGCGEGDCVIAALKNGAIAYGYDITYNDKWSKSPERFIKTCTEHGPYDIIMLYDVIDHMLGSKMEESLISMCKSATKDTRIYVRCHPYCSRHGTHIYNKLNKAYAHLFLNQQELRELDIVNDNVYKILNPDIVYEAMFNRIGLKVENKFTTEFRPEPIIETFLPFIYNLWFANQKINDPTKILRMMGIQFVDYVLKLKV